MNNSDLISFTLQYL